MSKLIYARGTYSVCHSAPGMGRDTLHGHSYEVWAYAHAIGQSVETLQSRLAYACNVIDHLNLDEVWGVGMGTMEGMADHFKKLMPDLAKVVIHRPVEGLGCEAIYSVADAG